jgi:CheY-like chemotaxis protein
MKKRVLVVDDSEIVLQKAVEALSGECYELLTALNVFEADRYIFSDKRPDVIIMDVMMPMLDGDKKTRMLKDDPLTSEIPVLLLSSKTEMELVILVSESGANGFIRKPFTFRDIVNAVESL